MKLTLVHIAKQRLDNYFLETRETSVMPRHRCKYILYFCKFVILCKHRKVLKLTLVPIAYYVFQSIVVHLLKVENDVKTQE